MADARLYGAVGALLAGTVACGGSPASGDGWTGSVHDSAGVAVVENPLDGIWTDASRPLLAEELRIGVAEGDPSYQFGRIDGIAATTDGRIVVLDGLAEQPVRIFDELGRFVTAAGGRGAGPAEFGAAPGPVLRGMADTVLIPDPQHRRVHVFVSSGGFVRSDRISAPEQVVRWGAVGGAATVQLGNAATVGMEDDLLDVLVAIAPGALGPDTLLTVPSGKTFVARPAGLPDLTFFGGEPLWAGSPDGALWMGVSDEYRLERYVEATLDRIVTLPMVPVPVTERDREIVLEAWAGVFARMMPDAAERLAEWAEFAETFPAFHRLEVGADGRVWVQRHLILHELTEQEIAHVDPTTGTFPAPTWDVFDGEGRYLGAMRFPASFVPFWFDRDAVLGAERDSSDVPYVVRLAME